MKTKKIFSVCAFLLAVFLILWLTVMTPEETTNLTISAGSILAKFFSENSWALLHIRKLAHTVEYFLLGLTAGVLFKEKEGAAVLLCMAVSFSDQLIKTRVPGRHWDAGDFPFDAAGYLLGIGAVWLGQRIAGKACSK